jgi:hypothetical protein
MTSVRRGVQVLTPIGAFDVSRDYSANTSPTVTHRHEFRNRHDQINQKQILQTERPQKKYTFSGLVRIHCMRTRFCEDGILLPAPR